MKETYYFPHDYHASKDPKCSALINDLGLAGYGLYWAMIEILHEQGGRLKKFPKLYEGLAFELRIKKETLVKQIEALLHEYNLLREDDNFIWSDRVLRNIEERKLKYEIKAEAGRLGGLKSGVSRLHHNRVRSKTKQNEALLEANEPKERKGKESKVNKNDSLSKDKESKLSYSIEGKTFNLLKDEVMSYDDRDHSFPRKRTYGDERIDWTLDYWEHLSSRSLTGQERWNRIYARHLANKFGMKRMRELLEWLAEPDNWWFDKVSQMSTIYKNSEKLFQQMEAPKEKTKGKSIEELTK